MEFKGGPATTVAYDKDYTIEEIDDELRREYLAAFRDDAGAEFHYIAALNDSPEAVKAYASIVRREAAGWI